MIQILATLLLLGMIVYGIRKKIDIATILFFGTVLGYIGLTIATGASIAGKATIGNNFLDIFEFMNSTVIKALTSSTITVMMLIAYMEYMQHIKATDMFATILTKPVQRIKSIYLIAAFTIPIGVAMGIVISSAFIIITLLLATIYPVLRALGCTRETSATAIMLPTVVTISPARAAYYMAVQLMGLKDVSVPLWFAQIQLPVGIIMVVAIMVVFVIVSKYFDKKEGLTNSHFETKNENDIVISEQASAPIQLKTIKDIGVPVYYAILPLIPLIIVVVFSQLVLKSIVVSVVGATLLSWVIAFIVHTLTIRNLNEGLKSFEVLYKGMGRVMATTGPILLFGTTFANMLQSLGGMTIIINVVSKVASGPALLAVICFVGLIMVALTGTFNGNLALVFPFVREIVNVTGMNALAASQAALFGLAAGGGICPVSAPNLLLAKETNTNILTIIKRSFIPTMTGFIVAFFACILIFA